MAKKPNPFLANLGLEDNDLNITLNAEHEGEGEAEDYTALDSSDTPESEEIEINDQAAVVDEADGVVDNLEQTAEALESLQVTLESLGDYGQYDPRAVGNLVNNALEQALSRNPGIFKSLQVPSLEKHEVATAEAMEETKEKISGTSAEANTGIIATLKKWWAAFISFMDDIFSRVANARKKSEALKKYIKTASKTADEVKVPGFFVINKFNAAAYVELNKILNEMVAVKYDKVDRWLKDENSKTDAVEIFKETFAPIAHETPLKISFNDMTLGLSADGQPKLTMSGEKREGFVMKHFSISDSSSTLNEIDKTINLIDSYNKAKEARNRFTKDLMDALMKANKHKDGKGLNDRFVAWRRAASIWRQHSKFEKQLISLAYQAVSIGLNVVKQNIYLKDNSGK